MSIWPLVLLFLHEWIFFLDAKCLENRSVVRRNYFHYRGLADVLTIETSDRLSHNITSNIFLIFLEEVLGFDAVRIIRGDPFNVSAALDHVSEIDINDVIQYPTTMFNLEVWAEPDFYIPRGQKAYEVGMITTPGRYGWFVTHFANVSWQTFQELSSSSSFSLLKDEETFLSNLIFNTATKEAGNGTYTPPWCRDGYGIKSCAVLLAGDYESNNVVVSHIERFHLYVRVMWLGSKLLHGLAQLQRNSHKSRLVISWSPGEVTANGIWYPVAFPPCVNDETAPGCVYETRRLVKLVSGRVKEGAPSAFLAASDIEFTREQYNEILRAAVAHPTGNHYDIACDWMRKNEEAYLPWTSYFDEKPKLNICGIFPLTSAMFGATGLATAAKMAADAVNKNEKVLPDHQLVITNHDGRCNTDVVMNTFINYILESSSKQLVGILGPACSDTVEPLVGLTKYFRTVVISYSAEGSTFTDREQYPYFFRTIGENQQYKHVYLLLLQRLGWKRIAALTGDGQKYTEYLSHLQDLLQTHNLTFITHSKFPKDKANNTMRNYLEDLRSRRARIIVADVYDKAAREVMCEALRLKMTAAEGYVWFLPQWLSPDWYNMSRIEKGNKDGDIAECTTEMMLKAIQGHFSLAHQTLAPKDQLTHEGITVEEWFKSYLVELNSSKPVSTYAGYAYDAVWTYALALDELYRTNKSYLADIHSPAAVNQYVKIIQQTNFMGVSGKIQFLEGASRLTNVSILQWVDGIYTAVGSVSPNVSETHRRVEDYKLFLDESKIRWFTETRVIPSDGSESSNCIFQSLADLLGFECIGAMVFVNVVGFGLLLVFLVVAVALTKRRYDKKVQKFEITEKYMKSMGFDLLASNLSDLDKWEIPRDCVVINRRLGEGAFGTVYGGEAYFKDQDWVAAAVKTLKVNSTTEQKLDFLSEAEVMKRFEHKNIVKLLGVCTRDEPVYTVMEFMLYGDIKTFLLNRRHLVNNRRISDENNEVSNKKLTAMALDIARGLSYLASLKYVHRDIACRNCLLNSSRVAKIGDFGLTRPMYENDYYKFSRKGMLPIRWMAPESLGDGLFTPSSDVWSFGVVLYEIVTFGSYPFQGLSNSQVMEHVKAGNTIDIPKDVKPQLESLIKSCWNLDYKKRPASSEIVEFLANNPRLLSPCLDVPASSVAVEDSDALDLPFAPRPSVPASPLETANTFFPNNTPTMEEAAVQLGDCSSPPSSPTEPNSSTTFFPDSARELLLPVRKPVHIAMAPLMSHIPSNCDIQSGSLL